MDTVITMVTVMDQDMVMGPDTTIVTIAIAPEELWEQQSLLEEQHLPVG